MESITTSGTFGIRRREKPFQGFSPFIYRIPGLSLRSNPGLELANAFGVWVRPQLELANAFGVWVRPQLELANAFGVWVRPAGAVIE